MNESLSVKKTFSLTQSHIDRLKEFTRRTSVKDSDRIRRLIDDEWERLSMDEWVRKNPRPVKD